VLKSSAQSVLCTGANGTSVTIEIIGCTATTTWSDGPFPNPRTVTATGNYTGICGVTNLPINITSLSNCPLPGAGNTCAITANASSTTVNAGQSTTLSYTGCANGTVTWDNGVSAGNNKVVTPSLSVTYEATCTPTGGGAACTSQVLINVNPCVFNPSATLNNINAGQSTTLTYMGCIGGTVTWGNGVGVGNNIAVSPTVNTTYTASCQPSGGGTSCSQSVAIVVTGCTLTAGASATTINAGQIINLSSTGCANGVISWDNGGGNGNLPLSPVTTTTYRATCTLNNSTTTCTADITVTVKSCNIAAGATNTSILAGQNSSLTYTGCTNGTVEWSTFVSIGTGNNLSVSPTTNTTYTAVCTPTGGGTVCTSQVTINVGACFITADATAFTINAGQSTTLSYTGCTGGAVTWDNGVVGTNNIVVSPTADITYTVTCTPVGGAPCDDYVDIDVIQCAISASATATTITTGNNTTLSYTGCTNGTVSWNNGVGAGNNKVVSPTINTTYTATCTPTGGGNTCTSQVAITVTPAACNITITTQPISATLCANGTINLSVLATSPETINYQWYKNSSQINDFSSGLEVQSGVNTNAMQATNVNSFYSGDYTVYMSTNTCNLTSSIARITVISLTTSATQISINNGQSTTQWPFGNCVAYNYNNLYSNLPFGWTELQ
jgi:hypothetical protein